MTTFKRDRWCLHYSKFLGLSLSVSIRYNLCLCLIFLVVISERLSLFLANDWRNENVARWTRTTLIAETEECDIHETTFWRQNVFISVLCSCKTSSIVVLDRYAEGFPLLISVTIEKGIFLFCPTIFNVV